MKLTASPGELSDAFIATSDASVYRENPLLVKRARRLRHTPMRLSDARCTTFRDRQPLGAFLTQVLATRASRPKSGNRFSAKAMRQPGNRANQMIHIIGISLKPVIRDRQIANCPMR